MEGIDTNSDESAVSAFKIIASNSLDRLTLVTARYAGIYSRKLETNK
jgi:hypothetical protein